MTNSAPHEVPDELLAVMEEAPYCQIAGHEISIQNCLQLQGQDKCFGCAAPTRLCEACKMELVAVSAVGLGSHCLSEQLATEQTIKKPTFDKGAQVHCQLVDRRIGVEMCFATQGQEECRNCAAESRLCEKCQDRPCRFPRYGLCLICAVEEYGEGWQEHEVEVPRPKRVIVSFPNKGMSDNPQKAWCIKCKKEPIFVKKRKLGRKCANALYRHRFRRRRVAQRREAVKLLPLLKKLTWVNDRPRLGPGIAVEIARLEEFGRIIGTDGKFGMTIRDVISELRDYRTLLRSLRKIRQRAE